jgi:hypothetical protein
VAEPAIAIEASFRGRDGRIGKALFDPTSGVGYRLDNQRPVRLTHNGKNWEQEDWTIWEKSNDFLETLHSKEKANLNEFWTASFDQDEFHDAMREGRSFYIFTWPNPECIDMVAMAEGLMLERQRNGERVLFKVGDDLAALNDDMIWEMNDTEKPEIVTGDPKVVIPLETKLKSAFVKNPELLEEYRNQKEARVRVQPKRKTRRGRRKKK